MAFSINDLKDEQLSLLGLTKKDVVELPPRTYNALMSGHRTSLIRFNNHKIPGLDGEPLDAKVSLKRQPDGTVGIRVHKINHVPKNSFQLSKEEITQLREEGFPFIEKELANGTHLITLDKETNEYVAVNKSKIEAPEQINGISLTEEQANDFKNGKEINVDGNKYRLNLNDELGISGNSANKTGISSLKFKHSSYTMNEFLFDLAMLTSGAGAIVMIGHLANLLINTARYNSNEKKQKDLATLVNENKQLRNALAKGSSDISDKVKKGGFLTPQEVKTLIEQHLDKDVSLHAMKDVKFSEAMPYPKGVTATVDNELSQKNQNVNSNTPKKNEGEKNKTNITNPTKEKDNKRTIKF